MRITAGEYRGRNVSAPKGTDTRPTASVVREAMFNILGDTVKGARVLDLFCGSGILSLEAISRGAAHALLVDGDPKAIRTAAENIRALGLEDTTTLWRMDYQKAIRRAEKINMVFDVAFFDPPYRAGLYQTALDAAFATVFHQGTICVCEYGTKEGMPQQGTGWQVTDERKYGGRSIAFVRSKHEDSHLPGEL
ncbi:16S rRNA (guanine(966)-N(2))-methyltransferase RsmD [Eubacteriales bacterium OttesenSCG-928-M02]|nr:16S rRNA (guanine(966)-N(2))-methyltransferase RsmD [Eubacteriales bacterium OttesenSCG-928-M02]